MERNPDRIDSRYESHEPDDPGNWPDNIVTWHGEKDPNNPMNWPIGKKIRRTVLLGITTMGASFASSSFSPTFNQISEEFGVSTEIATLSLSLYVLGFALGHWKVAFLPAYFIFGILIAVATAENLQTIMICRLFAGLMASAPISNTAGALADLWNDHDRAWQLLVLPGFSIAVIGGPTVGPLVGSSITGSHLGWRWTEYITAIMIFLIFAIDVFFLPETYASIVEKHISQPLMILITEPIILCLAIYNAFVYGLLCLLCLLFEAFPIEYEQVRSWTPVQGSLVFLAVLIDVKLDRAHEKCLKNDPETRLPPMMLGAILFVASLFWVGGGAAKDKSPAIGIVGAGCIGAGFILIFQNAVNYLIDAFTVHAASAQAANTFLRSLAGAGFPLFATPMFHNLGVNWASYLLGFIAVALIPILVLFYASISDKAGRDQWCWAGALIAR
ncbi:MFS general substrate transporter [Acephala macrosclerotiorum]|nr:MFS general substrate transporter [Acephala macrosclerotiorum]